MITFRRQSPTSPICSLATSHTVRGFTIIELLMVVSLIAILASLVIVAVNPAAHSALARNAERWNHMNMLSNGLYQYRLQHDGALPAGVSETPHEICRPDTTSRVCMEKGLLDISSLVPQYIRTIPIDPAAPQGEGVGYALSFREGKKLLITAIYAENGDIISINR